MFGVELPSAILFNVDSLSTKFVFNVLDVFNIFGIMKNLKGLML